MRKSGLKFVIALLLAVCGATAWGLTTDRDQSVEIEADWAEADDKRRVTVYKGQVVLTQGSIRITGDTLTMHFDKHDSLVKLVALGNRATFRQLPDGETDYQRAKAKRIEMFPEKDLMVLLGKSLAWQGKDRISADRIDFDTYRSKVKARTVKPSTQAAGAKKPITGRVRITIAPKKKCRDPAKPDGPCHKCRRGEKEDRSCK